ncbi:MAG: hypothetical protein NVS3B5_12120 [Sphingomicrobium sp.]
MPGHWEGDLIIGANGASAIAVVLLLASFSLLVVLNLYQNFIANRGGRGE